MIRVVLDTSILIYSLNARIDLISELKELLGGKQELLIPSIVIKELEEISNYRGERGTYARIALDMLRELMKKDVIKKLEIKKKKTIDRSLLEICKELNAYLATADIKLRKDALNENIRVIYPRKSKKKLVIT
ncbi:MAG: hypothetical protein DRJ41_02750 [Thermoprotei archaeon]|nr:MAG: hypothetical protein DRJ41_02750 [Thermoprotei archaeon]